MASQGDFVSAMTKRSLRTIRSELEFLESASVITPQQFSAIVSQLPGEDDRPSSVPPQQPSPVQQPPAPQPPVQQPPVNRVQSPPTPYSPQAHYPPPGPPPPTNEFANTSLNEKAPVYQQPPTPHQYPSPPPAVPPPAYPDVNPVLSFASAIYAYTPTDPGDLALQPHDRIHVLEHMNADWWRGRNERTNLEGIFPRSYVNVIEEKGRAVAPPPPAPAPTNYGNMPLEVSQSGSGQPGPADAEGKEPGKFEKHGKKFGKKFGNAAIFGAGATAGSNIINSIF